ncbi:MAG: signal peptidase I [Clostridia bacterium]|nr:signal peptidase I [Clostridia bacterium]
MAVIVAIIYTFVDIGSIEITDIYSLVKVVFANVIPVIASNCLCTYIAFNKMYKPSMVYKIVTLEYWLISPILPKVPWIINSVVDTIIPVILLVYIVYAKNKKDINKSKERTESLNPRKIIPIVVTVIIAFWFATGVFPIKPVAIATGSMETTLMVGDVAILKKCSPKSIEVGDIIQYQKGSVTIIHRVISKYYDNGETLFITKGDNNKDPDKDPVSGSQVLGKEIFSIKYLGLPAVLMNKIGAVQSTDLSGIETGR